MGVDIFQGNRSEGHAGEGENRGDRARLPEEKMGLKR